MWNQSLTEWTSGIKLFFENFAEEEYTVIYTREGITEYLVDLAWKVERPNRYLALVLESELSGNRQDIIKDFEKLIDIKSRIKVGVFRINPRSEERILKDMQKIARSQMITFADEIYLIIFMKYNREDGRLYLTCYNIDFKGTRYFRVDSYDCDFPLDRTE